VTFENPNEFPIKILKWFTPLEGIDRSLFIIMRNGKPVGYLGKLVKRPAPSDSDYLTINAGASMSWQVNLSSYYDLTVPGNYDVTYEASSLRLYAKGGNEQQQPDQISQLRSETKSIIIR
jgi:peptidyl-Lys metalloendopeptidase